MRAAFSLAEEVPLRSRNTFRVAATARFLATVHEAAALPSLLGEERFRGLPRLVLGAGSNVLFAAERFPGLVVQLAEGGARMIAEDARCTTVRAGAAYRWDALVDWTLDRGLGGLENLALIPGQAGAAPIQNIGAYGVEVARFVSAVEAFDVPGGRACRLAAADCAFGYRDSLFKREPDRWIVTALELELPREHAVELGYAGVREELRALGDPPPTPRHVAAAVRSLRRRRLPDPSVIGNAGSFFKNPVVKAEAAEALRARLPGLPCHAGASALERKLSAAWLIEQAGWRGYRDGDAGVSAQHALVLVNYGGASGAQLLGLARRVADSVEQRFGVRLEPEPRIVGAVF